MEAPRCIQNKNKSGVCVCVTLSFTKEEKPEKLSVRSRGRLGSKLSVRKGESVRSRSVRQCALAVMVERVRLPLEVQWSFLRGYCKTSSCQSVEQTDSSPCNGIK